MNNIKSLNFDIPGRLLEVYHLNGHEGILAALEGLHFDTELISSETTEEMDVGGHRLQSRVLCRFSPSISSFLPSK